MPNQEVVPTPDQESGNNALPSPMGLLCACFWAKVGGISATLRLVSFADPKALFLSAADMDTQGKGLVSRIQKELLQTQE